MTEPLVIPVKQNFFVLFDGISKKEHWSSEQTMVVRLKNPVCDELLKCRDSTLSYTGLAVLVCTCKCRDGLPQVEEKVGVNAINMSKMIPLG